MNHSPVAGAMIVAGLPVADAIIEARGRAAGPPWEFELDPGPLDVVVVHDAQRIVWHGKVRRGKRLLRIGPMPEGKPGDRSQKSISDGLGKVSRDLESCYADELRGNRRLAGRIVIRFTIEPDGKTSGVYELLADPGSRAWEVELPAPCEARSLRQGYRLRGSSIACEEGMIWLRERGRV